MKKNCSFFLILVIAALSSHRLQACTSFAVYSAEKWYGMNFDYPQVDIKFSIIRSNNKKVFLAQFGTSEGYVAGMNETGLFSNYQLLYYNGSEPTFGSGPTTLSIGDLNNYTIYNLSTVDEINSYIGTKKIVRSWGLDLHTLFADSTSNAMVIEPFGSYNGISTVADSFIVMTNFPVSDFNGMNYNSVYGVGSDRYKTAYSYIKNHKSTFGYNDAIETLKRSAQYNGDYPTQVSLIFNPVSQDIYFCMQTDFSKVWKVSLKNETIELYSGFGHKAYKKLNGTGIWSYDLNSIELSSIDNNNINDAAVYPNPANGQLNINLGSMPIQCAKVEIYTIQGKSVLLEEFKNTTVANIDISGYPKGIYVANIEYNGKQTCSRFCIE